MGILDIARGRETDDETTADSNADSDADTETDINGATEADVEGADGTSRRWLVVLGLVAVATVAYLVVQRRAAREAEFTEIELEPTDADAESESASTE